MAIHNYDDFCRELLRCGFSMGGGNDKGIFALVNFGWEEQDKIDSPVKWHTGDPDTDPWEWRMRVLAERDDIAYSKLFFRASGYITAEWYPYFYIVRRSRGDDATLEAAYRAGTVGDTAKRIYDIITEGGSVAYHEIKRAGNFTREENGAFERAITELQSRMFITMCGRVQRKGKSGEAYGWSSTVFTTPELFWSERGLNLDITDYDAVCAYEEIKARILSLNPSATPRKIDKFIRG